MEPLQKWNHWVLLLFDMEALYYFVIIKFDNGISSRKANPSQHFVCIKINVYSIRVGPLRQDIYC